LPVQTARTTPEETKMKYQNKEERQLNRLPNVPIWETCDLAVALMIGFVVGIIFGLVM
jgi:hypothetical protein